MDGRAPSRFVNTPSGCNWREEVYVSAALRRKRKRACLFQKYVQGQRTFSTGRRRILTGPAALRGLLPFSLGSRRPHWSRQAGANPWTPPPSPRATR